ncbi:MAG: PilZ domain-containing protein [Deltaproteobacteria bacterium]|nr:PilZ domain-containing protein [Deltaproteobacteria bacterium]
MMADFQQMPKMEDNPKLEKLYELNKKIDGIIRALTIQYEGFHSLAFKFINISGNGIKFSSQQHFSIGDLLEFKMILTMNQPMGLYIYGYIVNVEKQTSGYFISTHFHKMDDTIRDQIVRFTFEKERENLRDRQKENEGI